MTAGQQISTDAGRPDCPQTSLFGAANEARCVYLDFAQVQCAHAVPRLRQYGLITRTLLRRFWKEESAAVGTRTEYEVGRRASRTASGQLEVSPSLGTIVEHRSDEHDDLYYLFGRAQLAGGQDCDAEQGGHLQVALLW